MLPAPLYMNMMEDTPSHILQSCPLSPIFLFSFLLYVTSHLPTNDLLLLLFCLLYTAIIANDMPEFLYTTTSYAPYARFFIFTLLQSANLPKDDVPLMPAAFAASYAGQQIAFVDGTATFAVHCTALHCPCLAWIVTLPIVPAPTLLPAHKYLYTSTPYHTVFCIMYSVPCTLTWSCLTQSNT